MPSPLLMTSTKSSVISILNKTFEIKIYYYFKRFFQFFSPNCLIDKFISIYKSWFKWMKHFFISRVINKFLNWNLKSIIYFFSKQSYIQKNKFLKKTHFMRKFWRKKQKNILLKYEHFVALIKIKWKTV